MGRVAKLEQQARTKARQRRIAMDYDRATRDKRVEATAAEAILALGARDAAVAQVRAAEVQAGDALQRLRRAAQEAKDSGGHLGPSDPNPVGSPDVTLRPLGDAPVRHRGSEETHRSQEQPVDLARAR